MRLPSPRAALPALLSTMLLTACVRPAAVLAPRPPVPNDLLTCVPQPVPPQPKTDADVANFILDLADAGQDCRDKLSAVARVVAP